MSRYLPLLIIITVSLQGCGTLSRDECQSADWYTIGYQDGLQGRVSRPVAEHHEACARRDVAAQVVRYTEGRADGLKQFCSPRNGFRLGLEGVHYSGACPAGAEQEFLPAYAQGKEIFESELQIRRLGEILQVNTTELRNLTVSVQQKEVEMLAQDTTPKRRADLISEMSDLQETVAMVETEISGIEAALDEESRHLQNLRGSTRYR
ncbi:MAG: DUF2799 domain-containing protein [Thiogranum sp.]